jgi:predicted GNAT family N-acyltransferase
LFDEYDQTCDHFILFDGKNIVGGIRFVPVQNNIKLERMTILPKFRTKKHGKNTILQLMEYYRNQEYSKIILDSIYNVKQFYQKCGFLEEGKVFQRVGIDHIIMSLDL